MGIFDKFLRAVRHNVNMGAHPSYKKYIVDEAHPTSDPFSELRDSRSLTPEYQSGMNCFLDSIEDKHIRQRVYTEIKRNPRSFQIIPHRNSALFTVHLGDAIDAYNKIAAEPIMGFKTSREQLLRWKFEAEASEADKNQTIKVVIPGSGADGIAHVESIKPCNLALDSDDLFDAGNKLMKACRYRDAIKLYSDAIKAEPLDARAWANSGWAYYQLKDYQEAISRCNKALEIAPRLVGVWENKARILLHGLGKKQEAGECLAEAIKIDPSLAEVYEQRGWITQSKTPLSTAWESSELDAGKVKVFPGRESMTERTEDETEDETTWRLTVIYGGLKEASSGLKKERRYERPVLALYTQLAKQALSQRTSKARVSNEEINSQMTAFRAIERAITNRDEDVSIDDLMAQLNSSSFWNVLMEGMLSHDYFVRVEASDQATWMAEQIQKWKKDVARLRSAGESRDVVFDSIWNDIKDHKLREHIEVEEEFPQESHHKYRKHLPEKMAILFLIVLGYEGDFMHIIRSADRSALKSLFNKLMGELLNTSRQLWYQGYGSARDILKT